MKYTLKLLGIACLTTFTFSCNKSGSKVEVADSLVGEWELRQTSAAMNPLVGNYPPGNGKIVKFTETRYSIYDGGQIVKQGEYTIIADPGVEASVCLVFPAGQFAHRIIYDNDTTSEKQFFQITNNRLSIVTGCYAIDAGHRADYERVSTGSHN